MRRVHAWRGGSVALAVLGLAGAARADNANPNLVPLGENESFMGNTGIGLANDTGAVYYNPAGLTLLPSGRVSVSGAVYLAFATHTDALVNVDSTNVPFDASGFNTIPSTYVATRRVGDWVLALSVLVPDSIKLNNRLPFSTPNTRDNIVYSLETSELWLGLSAAHKLDDAWSVGLTLFGIQHEETQTLGLDLQNAANASVFASSIQQSDLETLGLVAVAGVSYAASDWLRLGLRAQTAFLQVSGSGTSYQVTHALTSATPTTSGEDVSGTANYAMPFDFGLGAALMPADWLTLAADASVGLGTSYTPLPQSSIFNQSVTLKVTPRFNFGVEARPTPAVPLRFGAFFDPSASGGHPGDAGYSSEDYYGVTAGVGLNDEHVRTCAGGFYIWSTGSATPSGETGTTAPIRSHGEGVLLTTAYSF
jgi:long-subunit fatty acid transport protein